MKILFSCDHEEEYKEIFLKELEKITAEKNDNKIYYISDYIPRRSERTTIFRIIKHLYTFFPENKYLIKLYNDSLKKFYTKKLNSFNEEFDFFFTLAKEYSDEFMVTLKNKYPNIKTILYLWDSLELSPYQKNFHKNFDYIFTFDRVDAEKYNFVFRPTFYIDEFRKNLVDFKKREIDLYYIGVDREKRRIEIIEEFYKVFKERNMNLFLKLYNRTKSLEIKEEIQLKEKILYSENMKKVKNSKVILDIAYKGQKGLTLRCFEAIATETKIITNNPEIKKYDFYSLNNIFCFKNIEEIKNIPQNFFLTPYIQVDENIIEKYSIKSFLNEIFKKIN